MKNLDIEPKEATRSQTEEVIVAWRNKRDERLAADKVAKLLKEEEEHFKSWLINVFIQQKFEGMVIGGKITGLSPKEVPVVEDKEKFCTYILETHQLELLQFRLATGAIKEREEAGISVPGIGHLETYDLFNRKA